MSRAYSTQPKDFSSCLHIYHIYYYNNNYIILNCLRFCGCRFYNQGTNILTSSCLKTWAELDSSRTKDVVAMWVRMRHIFAAFHCEDSLNHNTVVSPQIVSPLLSVTVVSPQITWGQIIVWLFWRLRGNYKNTSIIATMRLHQNLFPILAYFVMVSRITYWLVSVSACVGWHCFYNWFPLTMCSSEWIIIPWPVAYTSSVVSILEMCVHYFRRGEGRELTRV